jgi:uncharacterized membrane protein YccC
VRFDAGLRQLRNAVLTMAATLASYGSALALEHAERLGLTVVVLAVVLSLTLSRTYHANNWREWLLGLAVLCLLAIAASEVGVLLVRNADVGDALFVLAISGSIWVRRFGAAFARAGTLVALPFVALLVAPAVPGAAREHLLWAAVVGAIAYFWVSVARLVGERTRLVAPREARHRTAAAARSSGGSRRLVASTRMALQMGASLGLAFAIGRALFGGHWSWVVMTAFIVCSGNRGRGDVVYKSGLRIAGAVAGTVAATLLAGRLAPGGVTTVVVIFVVLGFASWLRSFSYAYWAAGITSVLALLYGYFGESGTHLLAQRLEGIVIGVALAVAVSWLLVPVRTADVLRRRTADALVALGAVIAALAAGQAELAPARRRFEHAIAALDEVARPLEAHRFLTRRGSDRAHAADTIDALRRYRAPVARIVGSVATDPQALTTPVVTAASRIVASRIVAARRALVAQHEGGEANLSGSQDERRASKPTLESALAELNGALTGLADDYQAIAGTSRDRSAASNETVQPA